MQIGFVRGDQFVQRAEMPRQILGSGLPDITDAQRKNEARQRGRLAVLDGREQIGRRLFGHAFQTGERLQAQSI